jgi:DNA invertase Pin-like site-specific DNA recombinase
MTSREQGKVGPVRARLYARVSHSNGDQNPENQLVPLRKFADARGWKVAGVYTDKASAVGKDNRVNAKRVEWARLMSDAKVGEVILVWRLDRAFRSVIHAAEDVEALKSRGVAFVSMTEGFDVTTNGGQLFFDMLAAFAAFERRTISERIRNDKAIAREKHRKLGGWRKGKRRGPMSAEHRKSISEGRRRKAVGAGQMTVDEGGLR